MRLDDALRRAIQESGYSARALAAEAKVDARGISRFLLRERDIGFKNASSIAEVLDLRLIELARSTRGRKR
jgi:ribosome-binding protein aMBF1 (putative translation factor)